MYNISCNDDLTMFIKNISHYPVLSRQEESKLAKAKDKGSQEARDKLILHNLRWVIRVVTPYSRHNRQFTLLELIQVGTLGLIQAVDNSDHTHETRIITYAKYWIKQYVSRFLWEKSSTTPGPMRFSRG